MSFFKKKENDEYDAIYGFEFDYAKKRIGKSRPIHSNEINTTKCNSDSMLINCQSCGVYMDYESGINGMFDSWWICPVCGSKVKEQTAYNQLDRENTDWINNTNYIDDSPEYCKICGGPWPDCQTSCKLFDE